MSSFMKYAINWKKVNSSSSVHIELCIALQINQKGKQVVSQAIPNIFKWR